MSDKMIYRFVKSVVIFLGLVVLVVIVSSCAKGDKASLGTISQPKASSSAPSTPSTPDTTPPSAPASIDTIPQGQSAIIADNQNNNEGSVKVDRVIVTTQPADPSFGSRPSNGYYVLVHVTARADSSYTDGFDISSADFYALSKGGQQFGDDNGNAYEGLKDAQVSNDLQGTLGSGQSTSGWLAFDVNRPHGKVAYAPNFDGQPIAEWTY